jgi:hypothetical protein
MVIAFYSDEKGAIIGVTHVEIKAKNTGKKNAATSDGPRNSATNRFPPFAAKQLTGAEQVGRSVPAEPPRLRFRSGEHPVSENGDQQFLIWLETA